MKEKLAFRRWRANMCAQLATVNWLDRGCVASA